MLCIYLSSLGKNSSAGEKKQHFSVLLVVPCSVLISKLGNPKSLSGIQDGIVTLITFLAR